MVPNFKFYEPKQKMLEPTHHKSTCKANIHIFFAFMIPTHLGLPVMT